MRVHDDHRAPWDGQYLHLQWLACDRMDLASTPLPLNFIVGVRVWTIKEPASTVVTKKVRTANDLEGAVVFLESVHINCDHAAR